MRDRRYKQRKEPPKRMVSWRATADEFAQLKVLCDTLGRSTFSDLLRHLTREAYQKILPNSNAIVNQAEQKEPQPQ